MIDFKPSEVRLVGFPPLVDTFGRAEAEAVATLLVRACQARGDAWQDVAASMLGEVIREDLAAKREPLRSLNGNPFFRPDPHALVKVGCAEWAGDGPEGGGALRFTPAGLERLRKWIKR